MRDEAGTRVSAGEARRVSQFGRAIEDVLAEYCRDLGVRPLKVEVDCGRDGWRAVIGLPVLHVPVLIDLDVMSLEPRQIVDTLRRGIEQARRDLFSKVLEHMEKHDR